MLNLENKGRTICQVVGDKDLKKEFVSVSVPTDEIESYNRLRISHAGKFQLMPDLKKEREILYITGPSGSGKSTFTRRYIEELRKLKKDIPVYLFSNLKEDESLDGVDPKRIKLD